MNRRFTGLTTSLAALALLSLPPSSVAQPPAPQPPATTQQPPASQTPPQTPTGTARDSTPAAKTPNGAMMLLDRISELVDRSLGDKDALARDKASKKHDTAAGRPTGTSGTIKVGKANAGQVSIDRAVLDEIKAEVEQLKTMLSDKEQ